MLNLTQSVNVSRDNGLIDLVRRFGPSSIETNVEIDTSAGQARFHSFPNVHLDRVQLLRRAQVNVEVAIVDGLDFDAYGKAIPACRPASESGHRFHRVVSRPSSVVS